jgi:hypothetical protein
MRLIHWLRALAMLAVPALVVFSLFVLDAHSAPPAPNLTALTLNAL